jgi:phenylalanyl-tRNA synthetase beta chain
VKILTSWLREFADVPASPRDLAWALHLCGFEFASLEPAPSPDGREDAVIDVEITANRPDCLNVVGLAREAAVRYDTPLRLPAVSDRRAGGDPPLPLDVVIEDAELCPRYAAAMADVRVGPSPPWMVKRLEAAGVRSINNIVDITNYVLIEGGHPLHAFDYARLRGAALRIRRARPGERVVTLDGQDRALGGDMLVIADAESPQAIAGVMGGAASEVTAATRVIAIESAYFQPQSIRRTSRRLALSTEASYRFERGADPEAPVTALSRVCDLIEQTGAGVVRSGIIDVYPAPRPRKSLRLRTSRIAKVLGASIDPAEVERILRGLGFALDRLEADAGGGVHWRVAAPSWRGDVAGEDDLIEEAVRHYGFDRLPATFPSVTAPPAPLDRRLALDRLVRRRAAAAGFSEATTFTFIERPAAAAFAPEADLVPIANPLSEKFAVLRPSLLPGLVEALAHNRRREQTNIRLYETGAVFSVADGEMRALGLAWTGSAAPPHWSGAARAADFFDMKGAVERISQGLGLQASTMPADRPYLEPGRAAQVEVRSAHGTTIIGVVGQLRSTVAESRGLSPQDPAFVAELNLDAAIDLASFGESITTTSLPKFPSIVRDLSILVAADLPAARVREAIAARAPDTLVSIEEFDRYQGKGIPEGRVSLSLRLTFRSSDRTLTDEEVDAAMTGIVRALADACGAERR